MAAVAVAAAAVAVAVAVAVCVTPVGTPPVRIAGADRFGTADAALAAEFPTAGSAGAVVLATAANYPDALIGTALAAAKNAPLLFVSGSLSASTKADIVRVLPAGGTVYLLGGTAAIPDSVKTALTALGFTVTRYAGTDRYGTALAVAAGMGNPSTVFLATGTNFPDALDRWACCRTPARGGAVDRRIGAADHGEGVLDRAPGHRLCGWCTGRGGRPGGDQVDRS